MFSYNILIRFYFKTFLWDPKTRKHICEFQWGQGDGGSSFLPLDLLHNKCPFSLSNGGEGGGGGEGDEGYQILKWSCYVEGLC